MENLLKIDKELLNKIRKELPHGAQGEIAEKLGWHRAEICNVLHGRHRNIKIVEACLDYITDVQKKRDQLNQRIQKFLNE